MIYEVRAKLLFDVEDEALDFYHDCQLALPKATVINPGQPNMEFSHIELDISNHELDPNEPSIVLQRASNHP